MKSSDSGAFATEPRGRVLIIDDEEFVLVMLKRFLRRSFVVTATSSPEVAIKRMENEQFDLILTDYKMPGITGADILKRAKELDPAMKVVVMSGHISPQELIESEAPVIAGAAGFLRKPFPRRAEVEAYLINILERTD